MRRYRKWRNDRQLPLTAPTFVDWMLRADPPLSPPKHRPPAPPIAIEHKEEIDPEKHARFLKDLEDHKEREAAKHAKAPQPE